MTAPVPGQLLLAPGTDSAALLLAGRITPALVARAGRLGVDVGPAPADGYGLNPAAILEGLSDLADYDPAQAFDAAGNFVGLAKMPPAARRAVAGLTIETAPDGVTVVTRIKFAPRTPAYALLARFRGLEPRDKNADVLDDLAALVRDARARAAAARAPLAVPAPQP
jgi:hypothetical protein